MKYIQIYINREISYEIIAKKDLIRERASKYEQYSNNIYMHKDVGNMGIKEIRNIED